MHSSLPTNATPSPDDVLDQLQADLAASDHNDAATGLDRRHFMFYSLVAAAATTFGSRAAQAQRMIASAGSPSLERDVRRALLAQQDVPLLGNGEAPALQFQPYPGGTGALMEKLVRERGRAAFERAAFTVEPCRGRCPRPTKTSRSCPRTGSRR